MNSLRVLQNYSRVLLIVNGRLVADIPAAQAREAGKALQLVGARAEEWEQVERMVDDQALMMRTGAPFSLTDDSRINAAAFTEAQWGKYRRYIPEPQGIKSRESFGRATIKVGKR